jgi:hypothetical protein
VERLSGLRESEGGMGRVEEVVWIGTVGDLLRFSDDGGSTMVEVGAVRVEFGVWPEEEVG